MPPDDDGVLDFTETSTETGDTVMADLDNDCLELLLDQQFEMHDSLMADARGNSMSAHSIVRHSAARKFNQEDPIEAAATEMILKKG